MKRGFVDGQGVELIILLDRMKGFSNDSQTLGENFEDTRLYRITHGKAERLEGGEEFPEITTASSYDANMGDAATLRKFIRFGKARYPARHYALVFYSHGDGKSMCADDDSKGDALYPAELTADLFEEDAVDLLGFDVCSMGGIEDVYQWRPDNGGFHAQAMVASASVSAPWPYDRILQRIRAAGLEGTNHHGANGEGKPLLNPATMTPLALGSLIVEEIHGRFVEMAATRPGAGSHESWGCYDLSKAAPVKQAVDLMARTLATNQAKAALEEVRGSGKSPQTMNYMPRGETSAWTAMPYFDLYDLAKRIRDDSRFDAALREQASAVMNAVDALVVSSFGMSQYPGFEPGKHGIYIVFPDGDATEILSGRHWKRFTWYHPTDVRAWSPFFGCLSWCKDGATAANGVVDNWFELMDAWFDADNDSAGGVNKYRW
jgi:clostripain